MVKRSLSQLDVAGKRVLVRVDFNVPIEQGIEAIAGYDQRLRATLADHPPPHRPGLPHHPVLPPRPAPRQESTRPSASRPSATAWHSSSTTR